MKRNKPDSDDSAHGAKSTLDRGDLSEWDYLTKFYDYNEMLDNHPTTVADSEAQLQPHAGQLTLLPSNSSILNSLTRDSDGILQKSFVWHGIDDGSSGVKSESLAQSSMINTESSKNQNERETDSSVLNVSSEHQRLMIKQGIYSDKYESSTWNHNCQQHSMLSESIPSSAPRDPLLDRSLTRPGFLPSDMYLPQDIELIEPTRLGNLDHHNSSAFAVADYGNEANLSTKEFTRNREFLATKTEVLLAPWHLTSDIHVNEANLEASVEHCEARHLDPISLHLVQGETQRLVLADKGARALPEKLFKSNLDKTSFADGDTIVDSIHSQGYANDCIPYHETVVGSPGELAPEASNVVLGANAHPQMTWCVNIQNQIVPPYQKLKNNSLLLKPLTPYNYFYRDERDNIVLQISDETDPLPPPVSDFSTEKMRSLLQQHWYVDPLKAKRIHRKTHGKMSFQNLSKIISERWRILPSQGREFYRSVARNDEMYYNQHLVNVLNNKGLTGPMHSAYGDVNEEDESKAKCQSQDRIVTATTVPSVNVSDDPKSKEEM